MKNSLLNWPKRSSQGPGRGNRKKRMETLFRAGVLTVSDKGSRGKRRDESGDIAARLLEEAGYAVARRGIVPDDCDKISVTLLDWSDSVGLSLILTSGGTGLSPTDVTPQATERIALRCAGSFTRTNRQFWILNAVGARIACSINVRKVSSGI